VIGAGARFDWHVLVLIGIVFAVCLAASLSMALVKMIRGQGRRGEIDGDDAQHGGVEAAL
jgi:hypothetical protein